MSKPDRAQRHARLTAHAENGGGADSATRGTVAWVIILLSGLLVAGFGGAAIVTAVFSASDPGRQSAAETAFSIFNLLLPLVSAWVGAILAYFFVNQATETANKTTREALRQRSFADRVKVLPIMSAAKTFAEISRIEVERDEGGTLITPLSDVVAIFETQRRTRAPIFEWREDKGAFVLIYVLHESTVFDFLRRWPEAREGSLQALIDNAQIRPRWDQTLAHLPQTATLADAKAVMDSNSRIQDVVVTLHGAPDGPFVGWLTNVDVLRHCIAGASAFD